MRALTRVRAGVLLGLVLALSVALATATAHSPDPATTVVHYHFESENADGWTGRPAEGEQRPCRLIDPLDPVLESPIGLELCRVENEHFEANDADPTATEPVADGFLETRLFNLANGEDVLRGIGLWISPVLPDRPAANDEVGTITFSREAIFGSLIPIGAEAKVETLLVDVTDPATATSDPPVVAVLSTETLTRDNAAAAQRSAAFEAELLDAPTGKQYALAIRTTFTSDTLSALPDSPDAGDIRYTYRTRFDDVLLNVRESQPGPQGETGATGQTGPAGPPGPPGPPATSGDQGFTGSEVNSAAARRLLRLDRLVPVRFSGQFADQLRLRVYCKRSALRRCEGVMKVRSLRRINTRTRKGMRPRVRRVTFATGEYELATGRIGYIKANLSPYYARLLRLRAPLKVEVTVTVLDEEGRQQTLRRTFTARKRR